MNAQQVYCEYSSNDYPSSQPPKKEMSSSPCHALVTHLSLQNLGRGTPEVVSSSVLDHFFPMNFDRGVDCLEDCGNVVVQ